MIMTLYVISFVVIMLGHVGFLATHAQNPLPPVRTPPGGDSLEPLCEPDARIPDDLIQCGSCENNCGFPTNPERRIMCSCDRFCGFYGDCCQDFQELCPMEFESWQSRFERFPSAFHRNDFECRSFLLGFKGYENNLVIHTCPDGSECEFTPELNEDVNTFVPMYDVHRGVHYISGQCAVCNGAREVEPWKVTLECDPVEEHKNYIDTGIINSTESLTDVKNSGRCSLEYFISGEQRPCFNPVVSDCSASCENQVLISLCKSGYQSLTVGYQISGGETVYRNAYCATCNAVDGATTDNLMCSVTFSQRPNIAEQDRPLGSFSLTLVFDFDPRNGLVVGEHPPPECAAGQVFVPQEEACRAIVCSSGFILYGSDCIPETEPSPLLKQEEPMHLECSKLWMKKQLLCVRGI